MKFIVGLGNPGKRYWNTPHNVGFMVIDRFGQDNAFEASEELFRAEVRDKRLGGEKVFLIKPLQYMNLSGPPVRSIMGYFKGAVSDMLVVHDDLDLPRGQLRFRSRGSSGGHRGLDSIMAALGTTAIQRLKIGIGRDPAKDPADFVLATLSPQSAREWRSVVCRAAKAVETWIQEGIEKSAAVFNVRVQEPEGS
ncbi:MAG: aminoacyl-tRNA hydrolase [Planctomycetes bacterium]|nr:aminoacyl-tRNA hydrolase [Planctomycetota bacterium]